MHIQMPLKTILFILLLHCSLTLNAQPVGYPIRLSDQVMSNEVFMDIRLHGSLVLKGHPALAELSDLAWDEDEQILYGITDPGKLLHLKPVFHDGQLTGMLLLKHYPLLNDKGRPLTGSWRDAEGLALERGNNGIRGDSRLLISFERKHRIERYSTTGQWMSKVPLPSRLKTRGYLPKANKGLEALTLHPKLGLLMGPEYSHVEGANYLLNEHNRRWDYRPLEPDGALVALEALPDGDLLLLERAYTSFIEPWVISVAKIDFSDLMKSNRIKLKRIVRFDSSMGWRTQNFEGLTRHQDKRFFMASDDGNNPWMETQVIYFEVLK